MSKLNRQFFNRNTLIVAQELLGKFIVRKIGKQRLVGKIVEVEAYNGPEDLASHASRGQTPRNSIMFGHPGYSYVYLIYGINHCFNIVTEDHGYPAAILIRAVEPVEGIEVMKKNRFAGRDAKSCVSTEINLTNGPGKFCQAFQIDKVLNEADLIASKNLWLENGEKIKKADIISAKRIGVDYAKEYKNKLWRYYIKDSPWVSKK